MKTLFILEPADRKNITMATMPPLGVLSICSYLREKGLRADLLDRNSGDSNQALPSGYDVYGLSVNISNLGNCFRSIERIKADNPAATVAVGGPAGTIDPEIFYGHPGIDLIFTGEAEESFYQFVSQGAGPGLKGAHYRDASGRWVFNGPHELIEDLDSLPFPAWNLLDIGRIDICPRKGGPITGIATSRGCPFRCIFCSKTMGGRWRARSAENVVEEIRWHIEGLGAKEICIWDDNFSLDHGRAERICDLIIAGGLKARFQFPNGLRADLLTEKLIRKLKRAGVWFLALAPETGSEKTRRRIDKGLTARSVEEAVSWCRQAGIRIELFFMIGFPWETGEDIEETIDYARKLKGDLYSFARVVPQRGTRLFELIEEQGGFRSGKVIQSYFGKEQNFVNPHLSDREISRYIQKANRRCYLKPGAIIRLLSAFSPRDLARFGTYALRTRNL